MTWSVAVRATDLMPGDELPYARLDLVERYGPPDTLAIAGDIDDLRAALDLDLGLLVHDQAGKLRFNGVLPPWPNQGIIRNGDGTATLTFWSDTTRLWERICWPTPANAWTSQTSAYDVQTAAAETRLLGYITRNAGSSAYHSGADDRRIPQLRVPTTAGRGASSKTSARFQILGQLVADLAESANLRVTLLQTYDEDGTPFLDVIVTDVPDLSAWARFGDVADGDLGLLDEQWKYALGLGTSVILSAAAGQLENRSLSQLRDATRETGRRTEAFLDQRGTTDSGEIAAGVAAAMADQAPTVEVSAPLVAGDFEFGDDTGQIPIGAKVAVSLDGETVVDRIRQVTTTVAFTDGEETVSEQPLFGSPDAGLKVDAKLLRAALRRLRNLEST